MFVSAGNPVLSVPDGASSSARSSGSTCWSAIDLYVNETHRHADYVLPAATFYEREDFRLPLAEFQLTPFIQWTDAGGRAARRGAARSGRSSTTSPAGSASRRRRPIECGDGGGRLAREAAPMPAGHAERIVDLLLRAGRDGDLFGLRRGGLSLAKLARNPRGIVLRRARRDRRDAQADPAPRPAGAPGRRRRSSAELARLTRRRRRPRLPVRADRPARGALAQLVDAQHAALLRRRAREHARARQPADAASARARPTATPCRIVSSTAASRSPASSPTSSRPARSRAARLGAPAAGWTTANAAGGANVNQLTSSDPADLEQLAGMARLNGVPVRLEPVPAGRCRRRSPRSRSG